MATVNPHLRDWVHYLAAQHGLDSVRAAVEELADPERPETPAAIRGYLLADIATWPAGFRPALEQLIRVKTEKPERARMLLHRFESGRDPREPRASSCGCGCNERGSELGRRLRLIRSAACEVHAAPTEKIRRNRRQTLRAQKETLLEWLWITGQRKIDRLQLGQHAVEAAKVEVQGLESYPWQLEEEIDRLEYRLEVGIYQKGPRKGRPLTEQDRVATLEDLAAARARGPRERARIAELQRMVAEDVPKLVREYTGCTWEAA